jgi:ATP-binding cassette subfamily C protein
VVAHRLSTIVGADRIFFIEQGRVVETGTFEQLMQLNGRFKALAERQLA